MSDRLPTTTIGRREVPRVWVGDRAFIARYGQGLPEPQSIRLMGSALEVPNLGMCAGDEPSLRAALATKRPDLGARLLYHTRNVLDLERLDLRRCLGTLATVAAPRGVPPARTLPRPGRPARDAGAQGTDQDRPIHVGPGASSAFDRYRAEPPLRAEQLPARCTSADTIAVELDRIRRARPAIVTAGGVWLDFLCAVGRWQEARDVLATIRAVAVETESVFAVISYAGAVLVPELGGIAEALVIPINLAGYSMLPDPTAALSWARSLDVPLIAIHVLNRGQIPARAALAHAFHEVGVAAAIIGVGTSRHLDELVVAARATA